MNSKNVTLNIRIELLEKIDKVANARRETRSDFIRKIIVRELAKLGLFEDFEKAAILEVEA